MKPLSKILRVLFLTLLFLNIGCEQPEETNKTTANANKVIDKLSFYTRYTPIKIDIMPLTEFVRIENAQQPNVDAYVSLLDQFGSQIKSPAIFRFELYEYIPRSAEPKGKRAIIWQDFDLTDPFTNNDHWLDFLRAYQFSLPCELTGKRDYILQLTCLCPNGRRLSSEITLRNTK